MPSAIGNGNVQFISFHYFFLILHGSALFETIIALLFNGKMVKSILPVNCFYWFWHSFYQFFIFKLLMSKTKNETFIATSSLFIKIPWIQSVHYLLFIFNFFLQRMSNRFIKKKLFFFLSKVEFALWKWNFWYTR